MFSIVSNVISVSSVKCQVTRFSKNLKIFQTSKIFKKSENCHQKLSSWIVIMNCHHELSSRIVITNCHHELSSCKVIMTINKISDQSDGVMRRHDMTSKSNPRDMWPETWQLKHWLHFWQLRTTILTFTLWPLNKEWRGQHSQFLRCF